MPFGKSTGVHQIIIQGSIPIDVLCDGQTVGPGWTVIQQRVHENAIFIRNADFYGSFHGDFFLGLENIYLLTKEEQYALIIYINGTEQYAEYDNFSISGAGGKYTVKSLGKSLGTYSGQLVEKGKEFFNNFLQERSVKMLIHPMRSSTITT
ncbi:hypothetical protein ACLKA6_011148 [Drosophila palustris]